MPSFIALIWLGIVIGVSFIATPIKFAAPSLDLPTALEVGRVTFHLLSRVEWALAVMLCATLWLGRTRPARSVWLVFAILVVEAAWLIPALGARTDAIRAGVAVTRSSLHTLFILAEVSKCAALLHTGMAMRSPTAVAVSARAGVRVHRTGVRPP